MKITRISVALSLLLSGGAAPFFGQSPSSMRATKAPAELQNLKITILSTMLADEGIGEWGFAALVEADGHKILYDTGARPNTVLENARELHVDLSDVRDVILSHHHGDHTTGLMMLRRELSRTNPAALSRAHVSPGIFLSRHGGTDETEKNPMIAMKKEFEATGGSFVVHDKPEEMLPGVWLTGPVPRAYPEKNWTPGLKIAKGGEWVEDNLPEDQALIFNTPRGLVMLTGCGHAGIANILRYAREIIRPAPVQAAIGGFHLFAATDEQLDWTAEKLREFQTAQILGAHCTGIETVYKLRQRLGLNRRTCVVGTVGAIFDLKDGIQTGRIAR
jgi:7,8-dihydropterin-6-yl-methyl-4-(beta-D-ribofuranosyl)aminobenzene 5'-phosphate synthase